MHEISCILLSFTVSHVTEAWEGHLHLRSEVDQSDAHVVAAEKSFWGFGMEVCVYCLVEGVAPGHVHGLVLFMNCSPAK